MPGWSYTAMHQDMMSLTVSKVRSCFSLCSMSWNDSWLIWHSYDWFPTLDRVACSESVSNIQGAIHVLTDRMESPFINKIPDIVTKVRWTDLHDYTYQTRCYCSLCDIDDLSHTHAICFLRVWFNILIASTHRSLCDSTIKALVL